MLTFSGSLHVYLSVEPCDMRKSFNGLYALAEGTLQSDQNIVTIFFFSNSIKNCGSRSRKVFASSFKCAKHLSMKEQTERGRQVRQYFIDFEKAARAKETSNIPAITQILGEALRFAADLADKNEEQARLVDT